MAGESFGGKGKLAHKIFSAMCATFSSKECLDSPQKGQARGPTAPLPLAIVYPPYGLFFFDIPKPIEPDCQLRKNASRPVPSKGHTRVGGLWGESPAGYACQYSLTRRSSSIC